MRRTAAVTGYGNMTGEEFERYLGDLLRHLEWSVEVTQRSRDGGIDLRAVKIDRVGIETRLYVQCKNQGSPVSVEVVRELNGVLDAGTQGVVASPSGFTTDARRFAEERGIQLWDAAHLKALAGSWVARLRSPHESWWPTRWGGKAGPALPSGRRCVLVGRGVPASSGRVQWDMDARVRAALAPVAASIAARAGAVGLDRVTEEPDFNDAVCAGLATVLPDQTVTSHKNFPSLDSRAAADLWLSASAVALM